jgi:protein-S-isoprenylcysteine O-methyltransferase Ste14
MGKNIISLMNSSIRNMLSEFVVSIFLSVCLASFASINIYNVIFVAKKRKNNAKIYAEVERPSSFLVSIAALGTFAYFLEVLIYIFLVFRGFSYLLYVPPFYFQLPFSICMQIFGSALTVAGYFVFLWSVIVRGKYAVSWEMPENQRLVTWGPYSRVRHPSYLGYFLMFFGFLFLWSSMFTLIPLFSIPGYYLVTLEEERLLIKRFGKEYLKYQKRTGRFIPKFL